MTPALPPVEPGRVTFASLRHTTTLWEVDGASLSVTRYYAPLSDRETRDAQIVVGFGALLDTLNCRLRWHGRPEIARA